MNLFNSARVLILIALLMSFGSSMSYLYARDIISGAELDQISDMLSGEDFELSHTAFHRDWDPACKAKSEWHMDVLCGGISATAKLQELKQTMQSSSTATKLDYFGAVAKSCEEYQLELPPLPRIRKPKDFFKHIELCLDTIHATYQKTFIALNTAQRDSLLAFLIQMMPEAEDEEFYKSYFAQKGLPWLEDVEMDPYVAMIEKMDMAALIASSKAMLELRERLAQYNPQNRKPIVYKSKWGLMIIGSTGADSYSEDSIPLLAKFPLCLILDPGGDDIYSIPLESSFEQPFMLLADLSGNDVYRNSEPSMFAHGGLFAGADYAGDDIYQLADFSFSAVMGSFWHTDFAGDDIYQGGLFSQGAAILGLACLEDESGNDAYSAYSMSQAFGGTYGIGILADHAGADSYYLGGKYFHAPLMPDDYRTMGQGMGFGMRPYLAGGLGFLYDAAGNDKYLGGVYAQGVGYWFATGVLMDLAGNDVYNAVYYPQGSGIHMASGMLYDESGNDCYYSRNGPGQGAGHDYGFGLLIDAEGDDAYSIHGGNGLGISNSLGIFIDKQGNDRYERKEAQNYGNANFSRSSGGLGIFLDAGGEDLYPDSSYVNNSSWQKGTYGLGRDVELNTVNAPPVEEDAAQLEPPAAEAPIAEIFAAASEWEVGNAVNRVRKAREIMIDRAAEASAYILEHKLANQTGLEYRALQALCAADSTFCDSLLNYTADSDSLKAKTAIALLAGERDPDLLPVISAHLAEERYLATCIAVLGNYQSAESLTMLLQHKDIANERLRFLVARSISLQSSDIAKEAILSFEDDPSFLIQALIRNLPKDDQ